MNQSIEVARLPEGLKSLSNDHRVLHIQDIATRANGLLLGRVDVQVVLEQQVVGNPTAMGQLNRTKSVASSPINASMAGAGSWQSEAGLKVSIQVASQPLREDRLKLLTSGAVIPYGDPRQAHTGESFSQSTLVAGRSVAKP